MKHNIWYDDQNDVAFLEFTSNYRQQDVEPILAKLKQLFSGKKLKQLIIIMSSTYKVENRETRELSNKGLSELGVTHIGFVGGSAANRMIARVLIKTGILKIDGDFFREKEEAIKWLKSKRSE